ncbi:MAG: hypothetical protein HOC74_35860 [Gemmatimonadetes bacterium]|jgi:hypothetical protein|nr:hypothetical protein [Gemmatimonadota bacterium]
MVISAFAQSAQVRVAADRITNTTLFEICTSTPGVSGHSGMANHLADKYID